MTGSAAQPLIRVLVVDDQPLIRHSLRLIIESDPSLSLAGEADSGTSAVSEALRLQPDVVLMDVRMPRGDGIEATRRISVEPELGSTRILMLSMFELDEHVDAALRVGASGFLLKDAPPEHLIEAVKRTHAGESLFAPSILSRMVRHFLGRSRPLAPDGLDQLTGREREVLVLIARGLSNDEIARDLVISMGTVKTHIGSIRSKLHARDRAQLVIAAYEHGLL